MRKKGRQGMWMVPLLMGVMLCAGCQRPLFLEKQSRTPYDRYLALRGRQTLMSSQNSQGGESSVLRERLRPLGEQ